MFTHTKTFVLVHVVSCSHDVEVGLAVLKREFVAFGG